MLCPTLSVKLTKWSIKYTYIVPKIQHRQKSFVGKNLPKTLCKNSSKNPQKSVAKIFYNQTKNL